MAAKNFYAVKKGKKTGIFLSWKECKAAVDGFSGAEYKGFAAREEALEYLGIGAGEALEHSGTKRVESRKHAGAGTGEALEHAETKKGEALEYAETKKGETQEHAETGTEEARKHSGAGTEKVRSTARRKAAGRPSKETELPPGGTLLAYVDGSYNDSLKKYSFGCVFILPDGKIYTEYGNGDNPQSLQHRNVTGEMLGAMYATKTAMKNGFRSLEIRYDYQGIEKWVTGEWHSKTEITQKYARTMREWGRDIHLTFTKVAAHTNIKFNELADKMAKKGLTEADGIPNVKRLEDMKIYGTDSVE